MRADLNHLRHPKENVYGLFVIIVGSLLWLIVVAALVAAVLQQQSVAGIIVFMLEIGVLLLVITIAKMFYRAYLYGHAVLISQRQFPRLYKSLEAGTARLGMPSVPQAFLYNSHGLMNAFAMRVLGTRMVLLTSALVDVENDAQVDFVIGHELGHHAAGHLSVWKNALKYPGLFFPFLGPAYHRARELTADRHGAYCVGDYDASRSALHMLACGSARLNSAMDADAFAAQEAMVPPVTGFLLHIFSGYPRLTARVNAVDQFYSEQGTRRPLPGATPPPVPA